MTSGCAKEHSSFPRGRVMQGAPTSVEKRCCQGAWLSLFHVEGLHRLDSAFDIV